MARAEVATAGAYCAGRVSLSRRAVYKRAPQS